MPKQQLRSRSRNLAAASVNDDNSINSQVDNMELKAIALQAYAYWEARGRPSGSPEEDWFRAEREIRTSRDWRKQLEPE